MSDVREHVALRWSVAHGRTTSASRRHVDHSAWTMLRGPVWPGNAPRPPNSGRCTSATLARWTRGPECRGEARHGGRRAPRRSAPRSRNGRAAPGGTPTPTTTWPSTARTSATSTSSGARRACGRPTRTCSGDVSGRRVLEVGCGSAAVRAVARDAGRRPVALGPLGARCCATRGRAQRARTGIAVPLVQAGRRAAAVRRRRRSTSACSAFGAVPFVADAGRVMREVARVLRPGGRWVFAVNHPMRWMFSDDPGPDGLTVGQSVLRPHALRRGRRRGRADLRRAPPHAGRPGARRRRGRAGARRPGRARVAAGPRDRVGPVVAAARRPVPRHGDLRLPPPDVCRISRWCRSIRPSRARGPALRRTPSTCGPSSCRNGWASS